MNYAMDNPIAIRASESARAGFIRRTYGHLAGAILAFAALEMCLLNIPGIENVVVSMFATPWTWLLIVGAFIGVSFLAEMWARSDVSPGLQYLGLGLYVVAEAVIFLPLLYIAVYLLPPDQGKNLIPTAGVLTLSIFGGLTLAAFTTRKDFSFLRPILCIGGLLAFGAVICFAFLGGPTFGLLIAFAMVALASVAILYQTSNVIHHYRTDQHVAAALALFAAVATLFYYILWILIQTSGRD
jgi:FtsH-binding integral membrane protein